MRIRSTKMPTLSKHKWLKVFLDLVQRDLSKVNWDWVGPKNVTSEERRKALRELEEAHDLVIKKSDKGGNVVLMSETLYEDEALRLLNDTSTYKKTQGDPIPNPLSVL